MTLIPPSPETPSPHPLTFHLTAHEKVWLIAVLALYPLTDDTQHHITKSNRAEVQASQELLREAMAEQRNAYRKKLDQFLAPENLFQPQPDGQFQFTVTREQADWLLQVLNDIRVGSWIKLGRPEAEQLRALSLIETNTRHIIAMEICGFFQTALLEALDSSG